MRKVLYSFVILALCLPCFTTYANDSDNPQILSVEQNGNEVTVSLTRPQQDGAVLIVAVYNDVKLLNVAHKPIISSDNGDMIILINIPAEATTIKAFIWDGLNTMQPLCESKTFSNVVPPSNYRITIDDIYDRLDGSTVTIPLSEAVFYELFYNYIPAAVVNHNQTDAAIKNVINGNKDLALVTYPSAENLEYAKEKGIELAIIPIVNDAFVFLVNKNNQIDNLTSEQIRKIYSGEITSWDEVGGIITDWEDYAEANDELHLYRYGQTIDKDSPPPILPVQRNPNSGSQSGMLAFMGDTPIAVPFHDSQYVPSMGPLIDLITEVPNSIGYSYQYYANAMYIRAAKLIAVDGVHPTNENIASGDYPIVTPYYAVYRADAALHSFPRAMVELLLSEKGQDIAEKAGYVKLGVIPDLPEPGDYIRNVSKEFMIKDVLEKFRVYRPDHSTSTFRNYTYNILTNLFNEKASSLRRDVSAIDGLMNGDFDIIISEFDIDYNKDELERTAVAKDSYGFIVHKDNPVNNLTAEQLQKVYSGEITNWSELGGDNGDIAIYFNCYENGQFLESHNLYRADRYFEALTQNRDFIPRWEYKQFGDVRYTDLMVDDKYAIAPTVRSLDDLNNYKLLEISDWDTSYDIYTLIRKDEPSNSFARRFIQHLLSEESQALAGSLGYSRITQSLNNNLR